MLSQLLFNLAKRTPQDTIPMVSEPPSTSPSLFEVSMRQNLIGTCLPGMADEVLELAKDLKSTIRLMLYKQGIRSSSIEVRQRLSTKEYRVYIRAQSPMELEHLADIEQVLIAEVMRTHATEVTEVFWRFKARMQ